jgi:hypothetical protein
MRLQKIHLATQIQASSADAPEMGRKALIPEHCKSPENNVKQVAKKRLEMKKGLGDIA